MRLVLCLHNHQPEGTPADVLEIAYANAYWPTLQTIAEHPAIHVVLHNSGSLLENLLLQKGEYMELWRELVARGQVEALSSAIYEPILPAIPDRDRVGQIRAQQELLERTLGVVPRGLWLAERVWEPSLPRALAQAGIEYLPLDDTPFLRIGLPERRLFDSYVTEEDGLPVRVFPSPRSLSHLIPFARPEEVMAYLQKRHAGGARVAVFADAGERFGAWPGTHEPVVEGRWLSRFLALLEQEQNRIQTSTFAEYVDTFPPASPVYLPTGTYIELLEWSVPPGPQRRHHELRTRLEQEGDGMDRMLGIGFWRNFFVRYPEANWMHKRGLDLDRRLRDLEDGGHDPERVSVARRHIWRSQTNRPYWHGVTGGVYRPELREAVHRNQIAAWRMMDGLEFGDEPFRRLGHRDVNLDGEEEIVLENRALALTLAPNDGGALVALDLKAAGVNLLDTLARREEAYHRALRERRDDNRSARGKGRVRGGPSAAYLNYDPFPLYSLRDHFLPADTSVRSVQDLRTLSSPPARLRMSWEREEDEGVLLQGNFRVDGRNLDLERRLVLDPTHGRFRVHWRLRYPDGLPENCVSFATEWTLALKPSSADAPTVVVGENPPSSYRAEEDVPVVTRFRALDPGRDVDVLFTIEPEARFLRFPVETVSLSNGASDTIFQGTRMFVVWPLEPGAGRFEAVLDVMLPDSSHP